MAYSGDYVTVAPDGKERFIPGQGGLVMAPKGPKPADYVAVGPDGKERWVTAKKQKGYNIPPGFAPPGGGYPSGPAPYSSYGHYQPVPALVQGPAIPAPLPPPRGPGYKGWFKKPKYQPPPPYGYGGYGGPGYGGAGYGGYGGAGYGGYGGAGYGGYGGAGYGGYGGSGGYGGYGGYGAGSIYRSSSVVRPSYAGAGYTAPTYSGYTSGLTAGCGASVIGGYTSPTYAGYSSAFTPLAPSVLDAGYVSAPTYSGVLGSASVVAPTYNFVSDGLGCSPCDSYAASPLLSGAPYYGGIY